MKLWGEPLARELARGLAGTRVVELIKIEPDLDPAVHHTHMPYAIVSDRHTIAIVSGHSVMIDGPQQANHQTSSATTPAEIAANRDAIRNAAVWGVSAPAEHGGVADTALSIMRFLKQRGRWGVYFQGNGGGIEAYISARGDHHRWPAAMWVVATTNGVQLRSSASERVITSLSELTDFATREAAILDAEVLWCHAHVATLAKLKPFGQAIHAAFTRGAPERTWHLHIGEDYFQRDADANVTVSTADTREAAATLRPVTDAVRVTIGDYVKTFASPSEIAARVEEITAAVTAWLASPGAEPPVRDMDYYR